MATRSGFFYGWTVVFCAFAALLISNGMVLGGITVFDEVLLETYGWSVGALKFRDLITFVVAGFGAAGAGALADRFGVRPLLVAGSVFLAAGFLLYSRVDSLAMLYGIHVLFGLSLACAGLVINVMLVSRWFTVRRGTAIGIALVGTSLGNSVFPPLNAALLAGIGWREALGALAIVPLLIIPLALFVVKEWPRDRGTTPDGLPERQRPAGTGPPGMEYGAALRTRNFWALATVAFATFYAILAISAHLFLHLRGQGLEPALAAAGVSTLFLLGLVGKFAFGFLADRVDHKAVFVGNLAVMLAGAVLLALVNPATLWPAVVLVGLGWGGLYTLLQVLCVESFGLRAVGKILGTISIVDAIGGGLGIWLTGVFFDRTQSYGFAFGVLAALVGVALLAALTIRRPEPAEFERAFAPVADSAAPTP